MDIILVMILKNPVTWLRGNLAHNRGSSTAPFPQTLFLVVNSACNLHCKMCDIGMRDKDTQFYKNMNTGGDMSMKTIEKIIDGIRPHAPLIAIISTEPLLHPKIIDIIKTFRENGMKVQLTTNGLILPKFSEELVNADLDILYVSIDGTRDVHNEIRGNPNAWDNAVEGMKLIYDYKEQQKKSYPKVRLNCTISGYNCDTISEIPLSYYIPVRELDITEEIEPLEVSRFYTHIDFCHLNMITKEMADAHNNGGFKYLVEATQSSVSDPKVLDVDVDLLWDEMEIIKSTYSNKFYSFTPEIRTKEELIIYYKHPERFLENHCKCKVPWMSAQILADGTLGIATRCFNVNLGNVNETPFKELWNGEKMKEFRKNLANVGAYPACSRCCGVFG